MKESLSIRCGFQEKGIPVVYHIMVAPIDGSNIRIKRRQEQKPHLNDNQDMKIYLEIIFKFSWYASSALTVIKTSDVSFPSSCKTQEVKFARTMTAKILSGEAENATITSFKPIEYELKPGRNRRNIKQ